MAFTNDYFLRQVESLTNLIGELFLHKQPNPVVLDDEQGNFTPEGLLWMRLKKLLGEGKINEAEDALFYEVEGDENALLLPVAAWFYHELATFSEAALEDANFTPEEVADGWAEIEARYGLS